MRNEPQLVIAAGAEVPLDDVFRLRREAWSSSPHVRPGSLEDGHEVGAQHLLVYAQGRLAASARVSEHGSLDSVPDAEVYPVVVGVSGPVLSYNRLVVSPASRGQGLARRLDHAALAACLRRRLPMVCWTRFSPRAVRLERLGWVDVGGCDAPAAEAAFMPRAYIYQASA